MLGIYTGTSVNALTTVVISPDTGYDETITDQPVTAGTTYYIQLAGYNNAVASNILLNWSFVASSGYASWAGSNAFDSRNREGVPYGMAWILGATTNSSPSIGLLPKVVAAGVSGFTLHFTRVLDPGTAHLYLEYGDTLPPVGWATVEVPIPVTVPDTVVSSGISFYVDVVDGLYSIDALIPPGGTGKRFAQLKAIGN